MIGQVVKLENVPDEVFASGAMGKGIAIDPADGTVVAPAALDSRWYGYRVTCW